MNTHGVGIWLAMSISGAAFVTSRATPAKAAPDETEASKPSYIDVDTNLDDKASRTAKKAANGAKDAANDTAKVMSDGWITSKVKTKLLAEEGVDGSDINVDTTKRVVTLKGHVDDEAERARALEVAKGTQGVYGVVDEMKIGGGNGSRKDVQKPAAKPARDVPTPADVTGTR